MEQLEIRNERQWFKEVAKGTDGYHLPDPRRWHECTELFDRAAEAESAKDIWAEVLNY